MSVGSGSILNAIYTVAAAINIAVNPRCVTIPRLMVTSTNSPSMLILFGRFNEVLWWFRRCFFCVDRSYNSRRSLFQEESTDPKLRGVVFNWSVEGRSKHACKNGQIEVR